MRDFGSKILDFLRGSKIISTVASAIPHPAAQAIGTVARNIGFGDGEGNHFAYPGRALHPHHNLYSHMGHMGHGDGGVVIDPSQYHDYGCGEGVNVGGVPVGGKKLTRKDLRHRLKKM